MENDIPPERVFRGCLGLTFAGTGLGLTIIGSWVIAGLPGIVLIVGLLLMIVGLVLLYMR